MSSLQCSQVSIVSIYFSILHFYHTKYNDQKGSIHTVQNPSKLDAKPKVSPKVDCELQEGAASHPPQVCFAMNKKTMGSSGAQRMSQDSALTFRWSVLWGLNSLLFHLGATKKKCCYKLDINRSEKIDN